MRSAPLVAVAHGSTDPRSGRAVTALLAQMRAQRRDLDIRGAYLDHTAPDPDQAISPLATGGAGEIVAAPLLLTAAYHSKVDLPSVLETVSATYPWLQVRCAAPLGPHPLLLTAVERRLTEAGVVPRQDTALVLAAAGSSDPGANRVIEDMTHQLAARKPWHSVRPAYASAASPTPAEAVAHAHARGASRVAVATYLLAPGFFSDRIAEQAHQAGAYAVTAAVGGGAELTEVAEVALLRYDEALTPQHHDNHPS